MRILLLSMPDSFEHTPVVAMRMPNAALVSLAGNVDDHHEVAVADLILVQRSVHDTVVRLMREVDPDLVGLSVMTFQRRTALRVVRLIRSIKPSVRIVLGGYDPSLAPEMYEDPSLGIDWLVRGEGELTFRELVRAIEHGRDPGNIAGLSFRPLVSVPLPPHLRPRRDDVDVGRGPSPQAGQPRAVGVHVPWTTDRSRRDVPRLHLRLQLLFDHRDARQELPHLRLRAGAGGHRRRESARRARDLHR